MDLTTLSAGLAAFAGFFAFSVFIELGTIDFQPIHPPPFMSEAGYTEEIVVNRVVDNLRTFHETAITDERQKEVASDGVVAIAKLSNEFGMRDLVLATQWMLGLAPPSYEIEIVEIGGQAEILVRGPDRQGRLKVRRVSRPTTDPEEVIRAAAFEVLELTDAYTAGLYVYVKDIESGDFAATLRREEASIAGCLTNVHPAYACSPDAIAEHQLTLSLAFLYAGRPADALTAVRQAMTFAPSRADLHAFHGDILVALDRPVEAAESYGKARGLNSGIADDFRRWGNGYARQGTWTYAEKRFRTAHALGEDGPDFFLNWARVLMSAERPAEAIPLLERVLQERADDRDALAALEKARNLASR